MKIRSINPANNLLITEYDIFSDQSVEEEILNTHNEFSLWKKFSFNKRKEILLKISQKLKNDINVHAEMITKEMGKPIKESRAEILKCVWVIE